MTPPPNFKFSHITDGQEVWVPEDDPKSATAWMRPVVTLEQQKSDLQDYLNSCTGLPNHPDIRKLLNQFSNDLKRIREMRGMNMSNREIANAMGINEHSPLLEE
jgi:hypothetical protein